MGNVIITQHARQRYAERILESNQYSGSELDEMIIQDFDRAVQIDANTFYFYGTKFIVRNQKITTVLR